MFFITLCCMCVCHVFNKEFTYLLTYHYNSRPPRVALDNGSSTIKLCLLVHKSFVGHTSFSNLYSHRSPSYQHARRCAPPAMATSFFHGRSGDSETVRSLSLHPVCGLWNRLPTELKLMRSSTTTFKASSVI